MEGQVDEWIDGWMDGQTDRYFDTVTGFPSVITGQNLFKVIYINISLIVKKYTPPEHAVYFVYPVLHEKYCIFVKKIFLLCCILLQFNCQ